VQCEDTRDNSNKEEDDDDDGKNTAQSNIIHAKGVVRLESLLQRPQMDLL
jgi:hypothetical protein